MPYTHGDSDVISCNM